MYLWSENVASRGAQEVGSCLLYHLERLPPTVNEVILYSDSCGGQNRNIKMSLMLKNYLSKSQNVRKITQKFLVSGHSYNSCDRSFGLIEKSSKRHEIIATPDDWALVINEAKTKKPFFTVRKMSSANFFSSREMELMICNRKQDTNKKKISWLKIRQINYIKNDVFQLHITNFDGEHSTINIEKKGTTKYDFANHKPKLLYPDGKKIPEMKMADLMELIPFIKENDQIFFKNLRADSKEIDLVYASEDED